MAENLLKISFAVAILGTLAIVFLSNNLEPKAVPISGINERMIDEWVNIRGKVIQETDLESMKILTIDDGTASINAVLMGKTNSSFRGVNVEILGKVTEYRNELEIEISRIKNAA